ncbi:alpha-1,3-mannosyl-glycoprotein 2-beta-N-acetylglucosaminyltransferase [Bombus vosnesenskii]|uniref:Alpha-1,3-mannosyl-glycoprotein 2-beta-N-acetylglucosaminyltransferase n=1 Tax=Bombus vosnesenskii TaxID=207650 RepID=A0A6J3LLG7_9HYME|nr:alpha-1,3-mannosyl-glycoprotein 2-beta-N-acetylglucosaminyltransferase [Bombus vosnesenskii]
MRNRLVTVIFGSLVLWGFITYFLISDEPVNKERDTAKVSNQISKLERRIKQEIALNQELLEDIKEDKQRKKKIDIVNTNADEKQKDINHVNEDKLLFEKEEKDINNNDKNAQQIEPMYSSEASYNVPMKGKLPNGSPILAILVFSCNRITVQRCLDQLIKYRPSVEQFPIIVSEDCQHRQTADVIARYGNQIVHIQQPDQSDIEVPPKEKKFKGYFKIARHYGWALNYVFFQLRYDTVIIVEDDLDIAPDFFEYFLGTYPLLVSDNSLWCVSAWNDNGKAGLVDDNAADVLYRTDFFPGLGWMLTRQLWTELSPKWPKSYWDDWIRQPEQRRNRACIRPEISRTRTFGKTGVSNGMFYERHLKYIKLNTEFVHFTKMNLTYLLKDNYDINFVNEVYQSTVVSFSELKSGKVVAPGAVRIPYYSRQAYKNTAKQFGLMDDFRSGVPRTGYRGVVTFYYKGRRVHLAPSANWNGYDTTWS